VVKYIKRLPEHFTQLTQPKSSLLEKLVLQLQQQHFGDKRLLGKDGFEDLLFAVLDTVAGVGGDAVPVQAMVDAKLNTREWQEVAFFVLQKRCDGPGWLIV
jgi:hypothetical protein